MWKWSWRGRAAVAGDPGRVLERALSEEPIKHLGYDRHDPAGPEVGNSRNGSPPKRLLTEDGAVDFRCRGIGPAASIRTSCGWGSTGSTAP